MRAGGLVAAAATTSIVALTGLLSACSSAGPNGSTAQVIQRAPDATVAAGPARVAIDQGSTHATGVVDLGADKLELTVQATSGGTAAPTTQLVAIGTDVWTRTAGAPRWTHVQLPGAGLASLPGIVSGDPRALVALVRGTSTIDPYGGVQVRKESTIRYDLKIDPALATQRAPAEAPELQAVASAVDHTVRLAVYVDGSGRIRRLEAPEDLKLTSPVTRYDGSAVVATVDFLEFGATDAIAPPPADEVG